MSTVSALANSSATIFALDIYKRSSVRMLTIVRRMRVDGPLIARVGRCCLALPGSGAFRGHFQVFPDRGDDAGNALYLRAPAGHPLVACKLCWRALRIDRRTRCSMRGRVRSASDGRDAALARFRFHRQVIVIVAGVVGVSLATAPAGMGTFRGTYLGRGLFSRPSAWNTARPWYRHVGLWFGVYASIWFFLYWRFW